MNKESSKVGSFKWTARIVGILFIIGTAAGVLGAGVLGSTLGDPDYLIKMSANESQVLLGAFFIFIMAIACAGIVIPMYPILRKYNEALALGAVGFRLIEGVLDIVNVVFVLSLLALSEEFIKAGAPASSYFQALGGILLAGHGWVSNVGILMVWCIGALMYYYIFYQTKLVPRWLSGWGLIGVMLCMAGSMLVMFHLIDPASNILTLLNVPVALQEMVLAVWLIVKGFDPSAIASLFADSDNLAIAVKQNKTEGVKA
jgi:hypothetical protein